MTNNFTPAKAGQQSKRLSKEEYAEKMKAEKEAVYQMADDTAKAIVSLIRRAVLTDTLRSTHF